MMEASVMIFGLICLMILFLATLFGLLIYSGLFTKVSVGAGKPPIQNFTVAYKYGRGPYKDTSHVFTEVSSIAPKQKCVGFYYDDPNQVPSHKLRWAVGSLLCDGRDLPDADIVAQYQQKGYRLYAFPSVSHVVKASFPKRTSLSILIAIFRVYPLLGEFVRVNKLCAHPWIEIYDGNTIHFMAPLAKQDEFYVPEALLNQEEEEEEEGKEEISTEEKGQGDGFLDSGPPRGGVITTSTQEDLTKGAGTIDGGPASSGPSPNSGAAGDWSVGSPPPGSGTSCQTIHSSQRTHSKSMSHMDKGLDVQVLSTASVKVHDMGGPRLVCEDKPMQGRASVSMPHLGAQLDPIKPPFGAVSTSPILEDGQSSGKSVQDSGISSSGETCDVSAPASPATSSLSDFSIISTDTETSFSCTTSQSGKSTSQAHSPNEFSSDSDNGTETENSSFEDLRLENTKL